MSHPRVGGPGRRLVVVSLLLASCSSDAALPQADPRDGSLTTAGVPTPATPSAPSRSTAPPWTSTGPDVAADTAEIMIQTSSDAGGFDRRLLGTNVEAWLGAERFERADFRDALAASGVSVLRMPGGSWSNHYDWLACERRSEEDGCFWTWAARPTDFVGLLRRTGLDGMWTVSINETAQHSAALVAFFNGDVADDHIIGVDRHGVDWGTVGRWAAMRVAGGNPEPAGIKLWEVGNEVYGAKAEVAGSNCADFGWEEVWTCEGDEYVDGVPGHDGYRAIRDAMRAVDPEISVGAVGVPVSSQWGDWGTEVIETAGGDLDFYVIHQYGFDESKSVAEIVKRPGEIWPSALAELRAELPEGVPIAVTEHNLVSAFSRDHDATMIQASNALFLADTLGQLATGGAAMANQWDFASGTTDNGTNYGLVHADELTPFPTFFAMALWSRFGDRMHPVLVNSRLHGDVTAYAASRSNGDITVIVINRSNSEFATTIGVDVGQAPDSVLVDVVAAALPTDTAVTYNGLVADTTTLVDTTGERTTAIGGVIPINLPAWSITLVSSART